jgi:hypothetical protein
MSGTRPAGGPSASSTSRVAASPQEPDADQEGIFGQEQLSLLRAMERGFHFFGGVPRVLRVDNLKAAWPAPASTTPT